MPSFNIIKAALNFGLHTHWCDKRKSLSFIHKTFVSWKKQQNDDHTITGKAQVDHKTQKVKDGRYVSNNKNLHNNNFNFNNFICLFELKYR